MIERERLDMILYPSFITRLTKILQHVLELVGGFLFCNLMWGYFSLFSSICRHMNLAFQPGPVNPYRCKLFKDSSSL